MKKSFLLLMIVAFFTSTSSAQLIVVPDSNVIPLVNNFVLSGVTVSNVQYTGGGLSVGSFSNGNVTNLGMTDGIVMSTGTLFLPPYIGSPCSNFASTSMGEPGDALLSSLLGGAPTYDATILEFDLIPVGNMLDFQYVFASEEYPEYVFSTFNDIFGFFISGPSPYGGNYVNENIAIVPGTSMPVAINNVNATLNSTYFVDNQAIPGMSIVYDGFTTPLMAGISVVAGSTYHLKMAITDVSDAAFDSGIFLKAQSMKSYVITDVDEHTDKGIQVYPNPVNETSVLELGYSTQGEIRLQVTDCSGRMVYEANQLVDASNPRLPIGSWMQGQSRGIYFLTLQTLSSVQVIKIIW